MTKKIVKKEIDSYFCTEEYNGSTLITYIKELQQKHGTEIFFDKEYNSHDEGHSINIYIKIEETDEVYHQRLQSEAYRIERLMDQQKAEYERLKKIFEGNK
jgi:hypothetical protein